MTRRRRRRYTATSSMVEIKRRCSSPSLASEASEGIDYISDLPDVVRLHILSLLPLQSAIVTGVLSSKWRGLWFYRWPNPSSLFLSSPSITNSSSIFDEEDFVTLADRAISKRGCRRIDTFFLAFRINEAVQSDLRRWLEYAASCSVEDLHLHVGSAETTALLSRRLNTTKKKNGGILTFHFPMESPFLTRLSLRGIHLSASSSGSTRLESLFLHSVSLTDSALKKVISACPILRNLDIRSCKDLKKVICSGGSRLKSLTIVDCPKATELTLSATPGLRSFVLCGSSIERYSIEYASKLEEVYFCSGGADSVVPVTNWMDYLKELANVKVLTLCCHYLQYIAMRGDEAGKIRDFDKLEELQLLLMTMSNSNLNDIFKFLRVCKCDHLLRLFIEFPTCSRDPCMINFMEVEEENPPEEYFEKLGTIKIKHYNGYQNEFRLIKYFLSKCPNLNYLVIVMARQKYPRPENSKTVSKFWHFLHTQILLLPKASENVQIIFCESDETGIEPTHYESFVSL